MTPLTVALVGLFGALGSLARLGVALGIQRALGRPFPFGTLAVNLLGSFAIGLAMVALPARGASSRVVLPVVAGFLGGFTTYSAFAWETWSQLESRETWPSAAAYVAVTVLGCLAACAAGALLARK